MSKSTAAIEVEVLPKNGADTVVKNFKQQLKDAKNEAQQMVITFGEFSNEALAAQKKVAELSDKMDDFNDRIKALNPDKFAKVQTVVQGISRGFQAGQGAMALFGSESEDLTKTLVKVQGAMALADGLEGLGKVQQQFKTLASEVKGNVVKSFSTLKGAMSALGIGLLVAALGYVIANFDKIKKAVLNAVPGLATFAKYVGNLVQGFTDWIGVTSAQDRALEKLNKTTTRSNDQLDREAKLLEAQGNKLGAFAKERQKLNNELNQARKNLGKNNEKEWGKIIDDTKNALDILAIDESNYVKEQATADEKAKKDASDKRKADLDKQSANALERRATLLALEQTTLSQVQAAANASFDTKVKGLREQGYTEAQILKLRNAEISKVTKDFNDKQKADADKLAADLKASRDKYITNDLAQIQNKYQQEINYIKLRDANLKDQTKTNEQIAKLELDSLQAQYDEKKRLGEDTTAIETQILDKKRALRDQDLAEEEKKAAKEKEIQTAKFQAINESLNAITDIYSAFASSSEEDQKKAFEVNKAAQIAQAIVNTYQGVTAALTSVPLFPGQQFINAGLVLASGIAAVKKISDTKFESKSVNGNTPSQQSGQGTMQSFAPRMSTLNTNESLTQNRKVYVTEGDITRTQRRVSNNQSISVVE
jgi:uncharacterized coiled-coil protein SlyX